MGGSVGQVKMPGQSSVLCVVAGFVLSTLNSSVELAVTREGRLQEHVGIYDDTDVPSTSFPDPERSSQMTPRS